MDKAKPFSISKREVWEAYKRVKANRGAAGIDGQSITAFEEDLKNNLFKTWNRMSSGRYCSTTCTSGRYTKGQWGNAAVRDSNGGRPYCADGSQTIFGADIGSAFPSGFLWVSAEEVCD